MSKQPRLLVVGSFMMDLIVSTPRFPAAGETVIGTGFQTAPGGKGVNQAVQAARLGAQVSMVGKVGDDAFGRQMTDTARAAGVDLTHVLVDRDAPSGIGNVQLEVKNGTTQNRICVVPGANLRITPEEVAFLKEEIAQYDLVIMQLEIPMEINELVAQYAFDKGVPVMLNPAPSAPLSPALLSHLTYISPNEHEAADITGVRIETTEDARAAVDALRQKGVGRALITLGSRGAMFGDGEQTLLSPCVDGIAVQDPTAAGDSFVAAFCTAVCRGLSPEKALLFANHTAALTVSRMGALPSLPTLAEVLALLKERGQDTSDWE